MNCFHSFKENISEIPLPGKFTFPFYYEPHRLAKVASRELQEYLETQTDFNHDFGLAQKITSNSIGKMFGVLVVKKNDHSLGYLAAFSGKLADNKFPSKFVPPIYNRSTDGNFYLKGEDKITQISLKISTLKNDKTYLFLVNSIKKLTKKIHDDLASEKRKIKSYKKERKARKEKALLTLNTKDYNVFIKKLAQESLNDQFYFKELQEYYNSTLELKKQQLAVFENQLNDLKKSRKEASTLLQKKLFAKYQFLNQYKEKKGLTDIFNLPNIKPPAGAGDCSAPKLLQYAFQNNLIPITMAEFWWGVSPNSKIRRHKNFYPSCQSRCKPILSHMLTGIKQDENILIKQLGKKKTLQIIYEDDAIIVINKPTELLSVPGKEISDSVYTRIKKKYPNATGPLIVHRLDMSTSGILILTKTKESNKILQKQFIERTVKKRYVALLEGEITTNEGVIMLPIRLDLEDRPRQLVDFKLGKQATTRWSIIHHENNRTRIHFYPITGRTHQLRVHAAHKNGLNSPIVGDDLYGNKEDRLYLHSEYIEFIHPLSNKIISFTVNPDF